MLREDRKKKPKKLNKSTINYISREIMKDPQAKYGDVENKVLIIQKAFHPNLF